MNEAATPFPKPVHDKLVETLLRVQNPAAADRLYQRLSRDEQRAIDQLTPSPFSSRSHPHAGRTVGMWMHLRGVSQPRAIIDVGHLLGFLTAPDRDWLLREIGEGPESMDDAIAKRELVFDECERQVYWRGERIDVDWHRQSALWGFLWRIAELAKSGRGVDRLDFGENKSVSYVSRTISRLRCEIDAFPEELADLMVSEGRGTARLNLSPEQIGLFRTENVEHLAEVFGETP